MTWLYVPSAFVAAGGGSTSGSTQELDERGSEALAQSAWWRGKRSPSPLWRRRWSKVAWLRRLSGVTYEPSTLARGVASWIASLAATPASHFPLPVIAAAKPTSAISGQMSLVFFESANQHGASSRTSPVICLSEDTTSSESFKAWASVLRAHCGRRRKSARPIGESGCSSLLPTPSASAYGSNKGGAAGRTGPERHSLESMARKGLWPTPMASDGTKGAFMNHGVTPSLLAAVRLWPTPTIAGNYNRKGASPSSGDGLATAVGGQLNPTWVEWLMGWPLGWSDCDSWETESSPSKPPAHS